jgi:DNA-directed RNA polymerase specialized sigma24 family protein
MESLELPLFFQVLQHGTPEAVRDVLRQVEPYLRNVIHLRLIDGRLGHVADTNDIFQSLVKDFLTQEVRAAPAGRWAGGLPAYLAAAVRNKILTRARKERRHAGGLPEGWEPSGQEPAPDSLLERRDLLEAVRARLPDASRHLLELREQGLSWAAIADRVGGTVAACRVRLARDIVAVREQMGLED